MVRLDKEATKLIKLSFKINENISSEINAFVVIESTPETAR
jgi:hypothetical protein